MILSLAATEFEMQSLLKYQNWTEKDCFPLITGVGPLETAVRLTKYLTKSHAEIHAVVNFGVGGAYFSKEKSEMPELLDICLAKREVFGDFGISYGERIEELPGDLVASAVYPMDARLNCYTEAVLDQQGVVVSNGTFVTVNGVSGTQKRGEILQEKYDGVCENMEGAAVARVCQEFLLPVVEIRCISNYVEDRDLSGWKLQEACGESGRVAAILIKELITTL